METKNYNNGLQTGNQLSNSHIHLRGLLREVENKYNFPHHSIGGQY